MTTGAKDDPKGDVSQFSDAPHGVGELVIFDQPMGYGCYEAYFRYAKLAARLNESSAIVIPPFLLSEMASNSLVPGRFKREEYPYRDTRTELMENNPEHVILPQPSQADWDDIEALSQALIENHDRLKQSLPPEERQMVEGYIKDFGSARRTPEKLQAFAKLYTNKPIRYAVVPLVPGFYPDRGDRSIVSWIEEYMGPKPSGGQSLVVFSDDRGVRRPCESHGINVMRIKEFPEWIDARLAMLRDQLLPEQQADFDKEASEINKMLAQTRGRG